MQSIFKNEYAKVPFAFVAVILLFLAGVSVAYIAKIDRERTEATLRKPAKNTYEISKKIALDIETQAYYITMRVINNLTGQHSPNLTLLDTQVRTLFTNYLASKYPTRIETFDVKIVDFAIFVIFSSKNTTDILESVNLTSPESLNLITTNYNELDTSLLGWLQTTLKIVYPRVVGFVTYNIFDTNSLANLTITYKFDKNIYTPLPLLKNSFARMEANANGAHAEMQRLVQFILATIAQYRVFAGYASGGYSDFKGGLATIITEDDVVYAVNLALLIECARTYRNYDKAAAKALGGKVEKLLDAYLTNGTIDPADIYALYLDLQNETIDAGKVLAQAIYTFGDRFLLELLNLFWGNEKVDPHFEEPVASWQNIESDPPGNFDVEDWAKKQLKKWLWKFGDWLNIPHSLNEYTEMATIQPMITVVYDIGDPNEPLDDIYGEYSVFNHLQVRADGDWYMKLHRVDDFVDLILGDSADAELRAVPYVVEFWDNFMQPNGPIDGNRVCKYYLVRESLIRKHGYGSSTPYLDTLKYIHNCLNKSMKQKSSSAGLVVEKGFMDRVAYDVAAAIAKTTPSVQLNPKDKKTILLNTTKDIIRNELKNGLSKFTNLAQDSTKRDMWWREGAYKDNYADFIYALTKETVDLWYEAVVNLYDATTASFGMIDYNPPAEEQYSDGNSQQGDFNFWQDALKDAFHRVINVADRDAMYTGGHKWVFDPLAWRGYIGPLSPGTEYILMIARAEWPDPRIWGNVESGITGAVSALTSSLRAELATARQTTDTNTDYGSYGNGFYDFIKSRVGVVIIGDTAHKAVLQNLSEPNGWLETLICTTMIDYVEDYADVRNIIFFQPVRVNIPYSLWDGRLENAIKNRSILQETLKVYQNPLKLDTSTGLRIDIEIPKHGVHFADVQDLNFAQSNAPFITQWNVSVEGAVELFTRTDRQSLLDVNAGIHKYTWYNDTLQIDLQMPIVVYSGWNLESDWLTNDVHYYKTRGFFAFINNDYDGSYEDVLNHATYVSSPFNNLVKALKDSIDWLIDADTTLSTFTSPLYISLEKKSYYSDLLSNVITSTKQLLGCVVTPQNQNYRDKIQAFCGELARAKDVYKFSFYGLNSTLTVQTAGKVQFEFGDTSAYGIANYTNADLAAYSQYKPHNYSLEGNYAASTDYAQFKIVWQLGHIYTSKIFTNPSLDTYEEISLQSIRYGWLKNIYVDYLGKRCDLNIGVRVDRNLPSSADKAFRAALKYIYPAPESIIKFCQVLLYNLHNTSSDYLNKDVELFFELKSTDNYHARFSYSCENGTMHSVKDYFSWLVNNIRHIVYSMASPAVPSGAYSSLPKSYVSQNISYKIENFISPAHTNMYSANLPATITLPHWGGGLQLGDLKVEYGTFDLQTNRWFVKGVLTG